MVICVKVLDMFESYHMLVTRLNMVICVKVLGTFESYHRVLTRLNMVIMHVESLDCPCGTGRQTFTHIILNCQLVEGERTSLINELDTMY